jgi:pimeloyl-ACP methyl ester carboxylesterase
VIRRPKGDPFVNTRQPRRKRFAAGASALAIAASLALVLSGCVTTFIPKSQTTTTSSPAPADVSAALQPFYRQDLVWKPCAQGMQCTTAQAPLDWANPSEGKIHLAMIRKPATGKALGSLFVNPGGPGGSGVDFIKDSSTYAVDSTLQKNYNIIGFDPPGVGASSAVKCYDAAQMDQYLYDITPGAIGSPQWIAASTQQATAFAQACQENTGPLLAHVDTVTAAHDLDLLRALVGDKKLNYLGYSYGTYLGTVYAGLYPHNTGRLVLDGALDPEASNFEVTKVQAEGFQSALTAYLKYCLGTSKCPFKGSSVQGALTTIEQLLASAAANPIRNSDGRLLGADTLVTAIIFPLYDASAWPDLTDLFTDVMKGSASFAFELADAYNDRTSSGTYTDNSTEAFTAINCLDYTYDADPAHMQAQQAALTKAAPVFGPYMGYGDIQCAAWPYKSTVTRGPIHAEGAAPILVVGTTNDPATPYVWAKSLSKQLDSGHLVTYKGQGHTAYNKGNSCVNDTVDSFFVKGTVPKKDPMC